MSSQWGANKWRLVRRGRASDARLCAFEGKGNLRSSQRWAFARRVFKRRASFRGPGTFCEGPGRFSSEDRASVMLAAVSKERSRDD